MSDEDGDGEELARNFTQEYTDMNVNAEYDDGELQATMDSWMD